MNPFRIRFSRWLAAATFSVLAGGSAAHAQNAFNGLAGGPYNRLVIRNVMVIPGHGGPPAGPYDVVIERNVISQMIPFDPVSSERRGAGSRPTGDRVIEGNGRYLMPGMIDLHMHLRTQPISAHRGSLTDRQKQRVRTAVGPVVRAVAKDERSQARNRDLALERLVAKLREALRVERRRVATRPTKASVERRLESKRRRAAVKRGRAARPDD